jgi:hypothetical protein
MVEFKKIKEETKRSVMIGSTHIWHPDQFGESLKHMHKRGARAKDFESFKRQPRRNNEKIPVTLSEQFFSQINQAASFASSFTSALTPNSIEAKSREHPRSSSSRSQRSAESSSRSQRPSESTSRIQREAESSSKSRRPPESSSRAGRSPESKSSSGGHISSRSEPGLSPRKPRDRETSGLTKSLRETKLESSSKKAGVPEKKKSWFGF